MLTLLGSSLLAQAPPAATSTLMVTPGSAGDSADVPAANILTGEPLPTHRSPLHWGQLSVISFSADQYYWFNRGLDATQQADSSATQLSGLLVYSLHHKGVGMDIQYRPGVWFTDNGSKVDLSNQLFDLHSMFHVRSRWTMS